MLTQVELNSWLIDPVTKKIRIKIEETISDLKDKWVMGVFNDKEAEYARGRIAGLIEIFEIEGDE